MKHFFGNALTVAALLFTGLQTSVAQSGDVSVRASSPQESQTGTPERSKPVGTAQPDKSSTLSDAELKVRGLNEVFGNNLFNGMFSKQNPGRFNPEYSLMVGDQIQVRFWGGFVFDGLLEVDAQGNVFLPHIGPVYLQGVANKDLQNKVELAAKRIFKANVGCYASLATPQPVRVFVGGFVNRPGLYNGTSMDSLLSYLDRAGGIDLDRGSFLNVVVKRGNGTRAMVSMYDFLLEGRIPLVQLAEGDVIFVQPRQSTVKVSGLVSSPNRFEFSSETRTVADLARIAKPKPEATHVRVVRNTGEHINTEYYPLSEAGGILLQNGDELSFTADKKPGTITVRVEGEHLSAQEYVLPYGARFGDLIKNIQFSMDSDRINLQLIRQSVKVRQRELLNAALKSLETSVLTARSATNEESRLRKDEAELMLQWVERAKKLEPSGQVIIAHAEDRNSLRLENGDLLRVPKNDGLVLVSGEVVFPNAIAYDSALAIDDYIKASGGYSQSADTSRVIVAHRDGSFEDTQGAKIFWSSGPAVRAGDEILVLPMVKTKNIEITRGISQILYQFAIAAKVVFGL